MRIKYEFKQSEIFHLKFAINDDNIFLHFMNNSENCSILKWSWQVNIFNAGAHSE